MLSVCAADGCDTPVKGRSDKKYCSRKCVVRTYYLNNQGAMRVKRYRENMDGPRAMHYRVKHRAKRQGIPYNLSPSDIKIPSHCPVLGLPLVRQQGSGYHHNSPSIDRIYPDKGYVKGNIRVISQRANLLKSDATIEELEKVLEDLRRCR